VPNLSFLMDFGNFRDRRDTILLPVTFAQALQYIAASAATVAAFRSGKAVSIFHIRRA